MHFFFYYWYLSHLHEGIYNAVYYPSDCNPVCCMFCLPLLVAFYNSSASYMVVMMFSFYFGVYFVPVKRIRKVGLCY